MNLQIMTYELWIYRALLPILFGMAVFFIRYWMNRIETNIEKVSSNVEKINGKMDGYILEATKNSSNLSHIQKQVEAVEGQNIQHGIKISNIEMDIHDLQKDVETLMNTQKGG
jgi:hypothetical protein